MENNLLKNVNDVILKQIIFISENYKPAYFCGSIALNTFGIINRPVKDIDVCVHHSEAESAKSYFKSLEDNKWDIMKIRKPRRNNSHIRFVINNIEHCLFLNNDMYCIEVEIKKDLKIKISLPQETIAAKRQYIKDNSGGYAIDYSVSKHEKDVEMYDKIEKSILRQIKIKTLTEEFRLVSTITHKYIESDLIYNEKGEL
jgi:hypothetical protein